MAKKSIIKEKIMNQTIIKRIDIALEYLKNGYSVIPVRKNKRPYLKSWKEFQARLATEEEISEWWQNWPDANIGIVTGSISKLTVVDLDSEDALQLIKPYMPDDLQTPIARTPKGYHYYFRYEDNIKNCARRLPECDIRSEGGYIVASGENEKGKYKWFDGHDILTVPPVPMPETLKKKLLEAQSERDLKKKSRKKKAKGKKNNNAAKAVKPVLFPAQASKKCPKTVEEIFNQIVQTQGGKKSGNGYMCHCPAHDDKNPSLSIKLENGRLFTHCFAGCTPKQVSDAF